MASTDELGGLLMRAVGEIQSLRRRNESLEGIARTVEIFGHALFSVPPSQGAAVDIVWELNRASDELNKTAPSA
jgi:hypothetical protein